MRKTKKKKKHIPHFNEKKSKHFSKKLKIEKVKTYIF